MNKSRIVLLFFLIAFSTGAFFLFFYTQPVLSYSDCLLCDGNQYLRMYDYFEGNSSQYQASFPYYSRCLVPWLSSLLPWKNVLWNFQFMNLVFALLSVAGIYYLWKKLDLPLYLILIGMFWLLFHWTGILRLNALDPLTVDVPTYFFQALFILIVLSGNYRWLWALGPLAVLQRESILVLLIVLLLFAFIHNYLYRENKKVPVFTIILALVLSIGAKYLYTWQFPPVDPEKSSVRLVLFYIKEVLIDPLKIVRWLVGIFMAYGAFLLLALKKVKRKNLSSPFMLFLTLTSLVYLLLGIIAGGDSTRIVFLGFPFVMTWILLQLKDVSGILSGIALFLSLILMRLFSTVPDPGKDFTSFAEWYPEFAEIGTVAAWGVYALFCVLIFSQTNRFIKAK